MNSLPARAERHTRTCLQIAFWVPLAVCTYLAFTPAPPQAVFRVSDVVLHGLAFTYLTFALGLAFGALGRWRTAAWMLAYGTLIEVVQSFEPERTAELKDLLVDSAGIVLGLLALAVAGQKCRSLLRRVLGALG